MYKYSELPFVNVVLVWTPSCDSLQANCNVRAILVELQDYYINKLWAMPKMAPLCCPFSLLVLRKLNISLYYTMFWRQ